MKTTIQEIENKIVATLVGELDTTAAIEVEEALKPLLDTPRPRHRHRLHRPRIHRFERSAHPAEHPQAGKEPRLQPRTEECERRHQGRVPHDRIHQHLPVRVSTAVSAFLSHSITFHPTPRL